MNTGERILMLMQAKHLSYRQLQVLTGISRSTLNRYAQGKPIPMDKLEKIASALGEKPLVRPLDIKKEPTQPYLQGQIGNFFGAGDVLLHTVP